MCLESLGPHQLASSRASTISTEWALDQNFLPKHPTQRSCWPRPNSRNATISSLKLQKRPHISCCKDSSNNSHYIDGNYSWVTFFSDYGSHVLLVSTTVLSFLSKTYEQGCTVFCVKLVTHYKAVNASAMVTCTVLAHRTCTTASRISSEMYTITNAIN